MTSGGAGDSSSSARAGRLLILLLLAAIGIRLLVCFALLPRWEESRGAAHFPDGYPYLAQSLLSEGTLGFGPWGGASPTTTKGPGFPAWLAMGIAVGGDSPAWLGFWSGVPTLLLAWFLGRTIARRFGVIPAAVAVVALTSHPVAVVLTARVLPDEFYGALGMGACLACVSATRATTSRAKLAFAALAAMLLGAHMLARSTGVLTLVAIVMTGAFFSKGRSFLTASIVLLALVPPLLWSVRSSRLEERPVFVHSLAAYNFWIGEAFDRFGFGWIDKERRRRTMDLLIECGGIEEKDRAGFHYANLEPRAVAAMETRLQGAAADLVQNHPLQYFGRCVRGLYRFWIQSQSRTRTIQYAVVVLPLLAVAAVGAFNIGRRGSDDTMDMLCLAAIALHNIAYAMILPMGRFGVEVYPHVAWLAAGGVLALTSGTSKNATDRDSHLDPKI